MVDHSRQIQVCFVRWGECCPLFAFVLGIHLNLSLAFAFTLGQGRMRRAERQGRIQRVLNPNAQNLKQTLNLAGVVHHNKGIAF